MSIRDKVLSKKCMNKALSKIDDAYVIDIKVHNNDLIEQLFYCNGKVKYLNYSLPNDIMSNNEKFVYVLFQIEV